MTKNPRQEPYSVVSLFAGCGGLDLGFRGDFDFLGESYAAHPFELIWANEINPHAVATYRENLGDEISEGDIWDQLSEIPDRPDVLIGGFPCQDVSVNGKRQGVEGERTGLYRAMVAAVERSQPRVFVAENVKGLLMKPYEGALETVISQFSALGYDVSYKLYQAADYGVPQTRERVFIVGTAADAAPFAPPASEYEKDEWVTAETAIHDLAELPEDPEWSHFWSRASRSPDQGDRRLRRDRPGYTIRAEHHGNIQFHYSRPRRISMREAARLQSFPDDFAFKARLRETERQIGNAVPPVLGWHVAGAVTESLEGVSDQPDRGTAPATESSREQADPPSLAIS